MDSAAVRGQVTAALRADPTASIDDVLAYWDLPGQIHLRPSGRLAVAAPVSGREQYFRQVDKDRAPPSPFRVDRWREMRRWEAIENQLDPGTWRSIAELLQLERLREAGRQYVGRMERLADLLDPVDDKDLLADLLAGGQMTYRLALFASYVWHVCHDQRRPFLVGTLHELAELLGCSHRQASTIRAVAERKGLVHREPNFMRYPGGFDDRDGKRRSRARTSNLYEPGLACKVAWMRAAGASAAPSESGAPTVRGHGSHAIPGGSREDRTDCDPTPRKPIYLGGLSDEKSGAPAPPPTCTPPAPPPAQEAVPDPDRGQARGLPAASQQPGPVLAGRTPPRLAASAMRPRERGQPIAAESKMRASVGAGARVPATGRVVVSPAEAGRLPPWYLTELCRAGANAPALQELLQRAALWLQLTADGCSEPDADAAVRELQLEQEQRRKGGAGAVCSPQPEGRRPS